MPPALGAKRTSACRVLITVGIACGAGVVEPLARGFHRGATGRLKWWLDTGRCRGRSGCDSPGLAPWSGPGEHMPGGRAAPAVLSDVDDAVRPDGRKKPTPTICGRQGTACARSRGRCGVLTRDVALRPRAAVLRADGHATARRGQIAAGWLATADGRTVNQPVCCPAGRSDVSAPGSVWPWVAARGAADDGEGRDLAEAVGAGRQPGASPRASPAGTDVVQVRLVAPVAGPGLEPPDPRDTPADAPWIPGRCLSCR